MTTSHAIARWLPLKAAAAYAAIGQKRLVSLAQSGAVTGFPDPDNGRGDWIFDAKSLDRYRESQALAFRGGTVEAKAAEILATI